MPNSSTRFAYELAPRTLFAVGGVVPADDRQCWAPVHPQQWLPMQSYVLRDGPSAVVIDTSVTALRDSLQPGFQQLLAPCTSVDVVMTRYNFDTLVNFPWLRRTFRVDRLFTSLLSNFVLGTDTVMSFMDAFEDAHVEAHIRSISDVAPLPMAQNADFEAGGRRMRCVAAPLRLLQTNWLYDYATESLFCSDSWGFVSLDNPDAKPVIGADESTFLTCDAISAALLNRFDWLHGARTDQIRSQLDEFFHSFPVRRLCPSHGAIIEGVANVETVRQYTDDLLRNFQRLAVPPLVRGKPQYPTRVVDAKDLRGTS